VAIAGQTVEQLSRKRIQTASRCNLAVGQAEVAQNQTAQQRFRADRSRRGLIHRRGRQRCRGILSIRFGGGLGQQGFKRCCCSGQAQRLPLPDHRIRTPERQGAGTTAGGWEQVGKVINQGRQQLRTEQPLLHQHRQALQPRWQVRRCQTPTAGQQPEQGQQRSSVELSRKSPQPGLATQARAKDRLLQGLMQ